MLRVEEGMAWRSCRWLSGVCCCVLLACGNTASSPPTPAASESSAGADANATAGAGSGSSGGGGAGDRGLLLGGVAGLLAANDGGELSLGGAEDPGAYHGPVELCLYDADIPDDWRAAGTADVGSAECAVGVLGRFAFDHCRYELLETMPYNAFPFSYGHSPCCYRSKLVGCP